MKTAEQARFMREAFRIAEEDVRSGKGGPFGAVVVRAGEIIARATNEVTSRLDPTAHAEVMAIRHACEALGDFQLTDCEIYTSCEPCPMCLGAIYWARPLRVFYGNSREDAATIGFDDEFIYTEIDRPIADRTIPMIQLLPEEAAAAFRLWEEKEDKIEY
jgi:guanine deaminase